MLQDIELWKRVVDDARLLEHAQGVDPADVSSVSAIRKKHDAPAVSVALELIAARKKAVHKFGERCADLIADVAGVEQASGTAVARHKAERMQSAIGEQMQFVDLCCGIGGDSMAMVGAGLSPIAVDHAPLRAWMTHRNTAGGAQAVCADVADLALNGAVIHLDPARRNEAAGRRAWRLEDYRPGPSVIGRLIDAAHAAAIKLSPGIDIASLPWPGEIEFISEHGRLVQAVLWTGALGQAARRATLIANGDKHVLSGEPLAPVIGGMQRYLYTFDAAVERAELIGRLCERVDAPAVHPRLGLLTSERLIDSPWLTGFEFIERLPWRPKRVRQWLAAHDGGLVEVKTRGKACDPDREQRNLRGEGGTTHTVFVLRFGTKVEALITKRLIQ